MPRITIEIDQEGNSRVAVEGCPGPACKELTEELETLLGETVSDTPTREMAQQVHLPARQVVRR